MLLPAENKQSLVYKNSATDVFSFFNCIPEYNKYLKEWVYLNLWIVAAENVAHLKKT